MTCTRQRHAAAMVGSTCAISTVDPQPTFGWRANLQASPKAVQMWQSDQLAMVRAQAKTDRPRNYFAAEAAALQATVPALLIAGRADPNRAGCRRPAQPERNLCGSEHGNLRFTPAPYVDHTAPPISSAQPSAIRTTVTSPAKHINKFALH